VLKSLSSGTVVVSSMKMVKMPKYVGVNKEYKIKNCALFGITEVLRQTYFWFGMRSKYQIQMN